MNHHVLGIIVVIFIFAILLFANNASKATENSKTACYNTINNASGVSDQYKLKMLKECSK